MSASPGVPGRPTWAEIDLDALSDNLACVRGRLGATRLLAVVKADAYGHGALAVARRLEGAGVDWFGVATLEEGAALRRDGVRASILLLGGSFPGQEEAILDLDLTTAVFRTDRARALGDAAARRGVAAPVHVKIDTGMGRLGVPEAEAGTFAALLAGTAGIAVTGAFSHLSNAEDPDDPFTARQLQGFLRAVAALRARGLAPDLLHLANSPAILLHRATWMTLARPGLLLYGYNPAPSTAPLPVRPILTLRSRIADLRDLPPGAPVGYGRAWRAATPARIATLPIGYADGLPRAASNRGFVLLDGRRAPIVGRISMDLTTVDVTAIPEAAVGDVATVIGREAGDAAGADALAAASGTIVWEVLSRLGSRVPRQYREGGRRVGTEDPAEAPVEDRPDRTL